MFFNILLKNRLFFTFQKGKFDLIISFVRIAMCNEGNMAERQLCLESYSHGERITTTIL